MENATKVIPIVTPFNTGKVLIGCHHIRYERNPITRDGYRLQSALLASKKPRNADRADRIVLIVMASIAVLLPLASYVFNWKLGG